jgi:hypothetical protein
VQLDVSKSDEFANKTKSPSQDSSSIYVIAILHFCF